MHRDLTALGQLLLKHRGFFPCQIFLFYFCGGFQLYIRTTNIQNWTMNSPPKSVKKNELKKILVLNGSLLWAVRVYAKCVCELYKWIMKTKKHIITHGWDLLKDGRRLSTSCHVHMNYYPSTDYKWKYKMPSLHKALIRMWSMLVDISQWVPALCWLVSLSWILGISVPC